MYILTGSEPRIIIFKTENEMKTLLILLLFTACSLALKANDAENGRTQEGCGVLKSPPSRRLVGGVKGQVPWSVWIDVSKDETFAGTLISHRHFVTTSALVFKNEKTFELRKSGKKADVTSCSSSSRIVVIPLDEVKGMEVFACAEKSGCQQSQWKSIVNVTYIGSCDDSKPRFGLLLVEMTESSELTKEAVPLCLTDRHVEDGEDVHVWALRRAGQNDLNVASAQTKDCSFSDHPDISLCFSAATCDEQSGASYYKDIDGRLTALAVSHSVACGANAVSANVELSRFTPEICQVSGICPLTTSSAHPSLVSLLTSALLICLHSIMF